MPFTIPSFGDVLADLVADFQNRFPLANVSKLSGHWKRLAVFAGGVAALHRHIQVVSREVMPDTAAGAALDRWLSIYGLERKAATPASKADALRVTGVVASVVTSGDQLTSPDGLVFQANETVAIPAGGFVDVDVLAISTGTATRKSKNTVLTFVAPPMGIDAEATLVLDVDVGGTDVEDDGSARTRLLDQIAQPSMGGNANDFRSWAKEDPNVSEAYVYPLRGGLGSVHLAALKSGHGAARLLSAPEIATLQASIDAVRPVGYSGFLVLTVATQDQDVELLVEEEDDPAYAFHWQDNPAPTVVTYTALTRTLQLSTRPSDMQVGDRLTWKSTGAPYHDGSEVTVEALSGLDSVILRAPLPGEYDWTATPPVFADPVYAGGPLVTAVRSAVVAHMDTLGPGRIDTSDPLADYSYGSSYWEGALRVSKLHNLAQKVAGVLDSEVLIPTANVNPTNEAPSATVYVLVPRSVIVRKMW